MNTKDFVVLPWGKSGNSVKLKYKNVQELRMEKIQLELENQEMEKKLQGFQLTRNREKEEIKSSGYHWKAGKMAKLGNQSHMISQNKGNSIKLSPRKVKLKLLKQQLQEPVKRPIHYKMANCSPYEKPKVPGKACGQCESKAALLVCLECGEDYCSGCFAKIHQKGALKLHRTTLLQARSQVLSRILDVAHGFIKEVNPDETKAEGSSVKGTSRTQHVPKPPALKESCSEDIFLEGEVMSHLDLRGVTSSSGTQAEITMTAGAERAQPRERRLCEGSFDEDASARSFQEVLSQWRAGSQEGQEKRDALSAKPGSLEECEVQTNLKIWREPINVEFKEDSLSYMEKLWIKKHRRTPQEQLPGQLPGAALRPCEMSSNARCCQSGSDEESDVEETRIPYPTLFLPVELNVERPEPSIRIIELDGTYEEEFEEPGDLVPYKVELANAGSQLRHTLHDYQYSFPCESHSYQHHIFNKVQTELSNSTLPHNSMCYKAGTSNASFDNIVDSESYYPVIEKIEDSRTFEGNLQEKSTKIGSNEKSDDSNIPPDSNHLLPTVDKSFFDEKLSQETKEPLEFSNLCEKPNFEDSKAKESQLLKSDSYGGKYLTLSNTLLQEIAIRSKPVSQQYQGLERFFTFDTNERRNLPPPPSLPYRYSQSRIPLSAGREWIPDSSVSAHADGAAAPGVLQSVQRALPTAQRQEMGQKSQRPSTANLPLSHSVKKSSRCLSSPHPPSRSAAARSLTRSASETSDTEYADRTGLSVPFLDDAGDQQDFDSLEKELRMLRNLADPSEKVYDPASGELPALNDDSLSRSQISSDFLNTSHMKGPRGAEESSSSGRDTEMQSSLSLSESSTDEEQEDLLDKQLVIAPSWSKRV
ncbi:PREDICTED: zinc finger B-box domain-containing protein 1 isoform X3 [Chinchilla lanigera]|uniref:zinc finger B-box domain-containing protein 1 isoform X3 n=1 Tax=Chinchilla lanigera TaxID=34839 RepID=UPI000697D2FC|nr:PREDICTED: zinc finger B-box domain-containing protein 1 isoform X3 [Chinchilla lanigera]